MSIRTAARQAWLASQEDLEGEARQALGVVLAPFDVATLTTVDLTVAEVWTRFVVSDGDVFLAATRRRGDGGWTVRLVSDVEGWTEGAVVGSLVELGGLLPPAPEPEPEPEPEPAPAAWVAGSFYDTDALVTHGGEVWRSTVDANHWEPGVVHTVWVRA